MITEEELRRLTLAQLRHVHEMTSPEDYAMKHGWSDDGYDYLTAALDLASKMMSLDYEGDLDEFEKMLDPKSDSYIMDNYACDGICAELSEKLPNDDDGERAGSLFFRLMTSPDICVAQIWADHIDKATDQLIPGATDLNCISDHITLATHQGKRIAIVEEGYETNLPEEYFQ